MEDNLAQATEFQDPLVGRILSERYRVIRRIGSGGMGVVYLAEHVLIQRKLAIKILHSTLAASEELVQRFHREARVAAAVGDEHVVDVIDMGRLADGTYYIALEYLDGFDLGTTITAEGPLALARVIDIGIQLCQALAAVHDAGIVHRDLKPENIMLVRRRDRPDFVKVLDFGICKVLSERPLTATGVALGTPSFMAPEQLEARREVDRRADVYAVGAILFFAMSGRNPFECESLPRLLMSVWQDPAPRLRDVCPAAPIELEQIVTRALEKNPARRFSDARALGSELTRLAREQGIDRPPGDYNWALASGVHDASDELPLPSRISAPHAKQTSWAFWRRWSRLAGAALVVASCVTLIIVWMWWLGASASPATRPHSLQAPIAPTNVESVQKIEAESPALTPSSEIEASSNAPQHRGAQRSPRRDVKPTKQLNEAAAREAESSTRHELRAKTIGEQVTTDEPPAAPPPPRESQIDTSTSGHPIVPPPAELKRVL